jgi:hypothetical protein
MSMKSLHTFVSYSFLFVQEIKTCLKWDKSSHLIVLIMRSLNVKITSPSKSGTRIFTPRPKGTWRLSLRLRGTSPGKEKEMSVYNLTQACFTFYAVRPSMAKFGLHAGNMELNTKSEELIKVKGKGLPQQAEVAQGVPGRLRPRIFLTFSTTRVVGRSSALGTGRLYPRRNPWYPFLEAESTPGHMVWRINKHVKFTYALGYTPWAIKIYWQ